jgi:hypothetical protein
MPRRMPRRVHLALIGALGLIVLVIGARTIELAGKAPIDFDAFAIDPPSVAGFVTVEDHGTLQFQLRPKVR